MLNFKVGDKVMIGVYVIGKWKPMHPGIITSISNDGTLAQVDTMSLHGGRPWLNLHKVSDLRAFEGPSHDR